MSWGQNERLCLYVEHPRTVSFVFSHKQIGGGSTTLLAPSFSFSLSLPRARVYCPSRLFLLLAYVRKCTI